jgi:hypothetical protein
LGELVWRPNDLTLRVSLRTGTVESFDRTGADGALPAGASEANSSARPTWILIDVVDAKGRHCGTVEAPARDFKLPLDYEMATRVQADEAAYALPIHVAAALASLCVPDSRLWIWLVEPVGYLPVIPWESLLSEALGVPAMRLGTNPIAALTLERVVEVALCFSLPPKSPGLGTIERVIELFLSMLPTTAISERRARMHVFADGVSRAALTRSRTRLETTACEVIIYEPRTGTHYLDEDAVAPEGVQAFLNNLQRNFASLLRRGARPGQAGTAATFESIAPILLKIDNPWLRWMHEELGLRAIDYVHIVTHGNLGPETGRLRFVAPLVSNDKRWGRPVNARELDAFLLSLGAWSIGISSPPGNASIAGLRYLAHELGTMRPGPVLLHDMVRDVGRQALLNGYRYFTTHDGSPFSEAVTVVANPELEQAASSPRGDLERFTLAGVIATQYATSEPPAWLVTAQRLLEASATALQRDSSGEFDDAIKEGIQNGLLFTRETIAKIAAESNAPERML